VARREIVAAFLAGIATADECLVAELGGGIAESCTGAPDAPSAPVYVARTSNAQVWGERALAEIRREFAALRSVRQLARRLRCHPVYLARTFRRALDVSVSGYLAAFKVGVAFRLLTNTDLKICAIPGVAGFGGKATLYRHVHRLTGHAPGYWRALGQGSAAASTGEVDHAAPRASEISSYGCARWPHSPPRTYQIDRAGADHDGAHGRAASVAAADPTGSTVSERAGSAGGEPRPRSDQRVGADFSQIWLGTMSRPLVAFMRPLSICEPPS
jgi:AraC-like DNA-binding protein